MCRDLHGALSDGEIDSVHESISDRIGTFECFNLLFGKKKKTNYHPRIGATRAPPFRHVKFFS